MDSISEDEQKIIKSCSISIIEQENYERISRPNKLLRVKAGQTLTYLLVNCVTSRDNAIQLIGNCMSDYNLLYKINFSCPSIFMFFFWNRSTVWCRLLKNLIIRQLPWYIGLEYTREYLKRHVDDINIGSGERRSSSLGAFTNFVGDSKIVGNLLQHQKARYPTAFNSLLTFLKL